MSETADRSCPDCRGALHEIKLIDRGGGDTAIYEHASIRYALPEARRNFWTGAFPVEGKLAAYMCDGCARVFLYGIPKSEG
jgi:hypothetical protein